jgi:enoyl-[acyl-carrier protein] reductase/trans-2-enoyl-CoA reductase (NAD+)
MGGEDWKFWIEDLKAAGVLAEGAKTVAYSYIGPELTYPIYRNGTIGRAKDDLEGTVPAINAILSDINGVSYVSVNKALVTQSSSAIPVVPLYISLLYKVMKKKVFTKVQLNKCNVCLLSDFIPLTERYCLMTKVVSVLMT